MREEVESCNDWTSYDLKCVLKIYLCTEVQKKICFSLPEIFFNIFLKVAQNVSNKFY